MVLSEQAGILILDKQSQTNTDQQELENIISSREDGFGAILRRRREAKNMTLRDVVRELHLDEKFIQAIECEDYKQLPVPAFVCGYIRNYARLLGLQHESLVADYKKCVGNQVIEPELRVTKQKQINNSSMQSTFFIFVFKIILFAALVFGSWNLWLYISEHYLKNTQAIDNDVELSIDSPIINAVDDTETLLLPVIDTASSEGTAITTEALQEAIVDTGNIAVEMNETVVELVDEVSTEVEISIETEISPNEAAESIANPESTSNENTNNEPVVIEKVVNVTENTNQLIDKKLILEFSGDSWIKIKDAANKTLSSGTKKSGLILTLEGLRPYSMTIGNATKVKVTIDGQIFDHSAFTNENSIARYTLP